MREDITVGGTFPDYRLPDQDGQERSLGELQGRNPMVLHLSRGGFDPKERRFASRLVDA
jgi:peroxiredoxin